MSIIPFVARNLLHTFQPNHITVGVVRVDQFLPFELLCVSPEEEDD